METCKSYKRNIFTESGFCPILENTRCDGNNPVCPFYKTRQQVEEGKAKWAARLSSLSEEEQEYIAHKYYYGSRPWDADYVKGSVSA